MACHLRLLCLDGGGVRGLSSLYLLKQLMESIDRRNPPKPCDFFHMIGGTSTGGLIAIMLGRLEMNIDECIDCYINIMEGVFQKIRHRVNIRGKFQGRYDSKELKYCIKDVIEGQGIHPDARLRVERDDGCKVFVCVVNSETREVEQFTSYVRDLESMSTLYDNVKIWEAARATSAAIFFFDPISIGRGDLRQRFVDGATGANNPVRRLWQEAQRQWPGPLGPQIQCLVSIGTGASSMKSFGDTPIQVMQTLKAMATETERTATEFQAEHDDLAQRGAYIRLNVTSGLENVSLDEAAKKGRILAATRRYGELQEVRNALMRFRAAVADFDMDSVDEDELHLNFQTDAPEPASMRPVRKSQNQAHQQGTETGPPRSFPLNFFGHGPKFFKQPAKHYWDHLTLDSLRKYEDIYGRICNRGDGLVPYSSFFDFWYRRTLYEFPNWEEVLRRNWLLLAPRHHLLPKNLTMALLYIFHVECVSPDESWDPDSRQTQKALRSFGNWIQCLCGCGRRWNFANSTEGLRDDDLRTKECVPGAWKDADDLNEVLRWGLDAPSLFKSNVKEWYARQVYPVARPANQSIQFN